MPRNSAKTLSFQRWCERRGHPHYVKVKPDYRFFTLDDFNNSEKEEWKNGLAAEVYYLNAGDSAEIFGGKRFYLISLEVYLRIAVAVRGIQLQQHIARATQSYCGLCG